MSVRLEQMKKLRTALDAIVVLTRSNVVITFPGSSSPGADVKRTHDDQLSLHLAEALAATNELWRLLPDDERRP